MISGAPGDLHGAFFYVAIFICTSAVCDKLLH
jgi:hypothetical protein